MLIISFSFISLFGLGLENNYFQINENNDDNDGLLKWEITLCKQSYSHFNKQNIREYKYIQMLYFQGKKLYMIDSFNKLKSVSL